MLVLLNLSDVQVESDQRPTLVTPRFSIAGILYPVYTTVGENTNNGQDLPRRSSWRSLIGLRVDGACVSSSGVSFILSVRHAEVARVHRSSPLLLARVLPPLQHNPP